MVKVFIGSDHAGFDAKIKVCEILTNLNIDFEDLGCDSSNKKVDYPIYAKSVCRQVLKNKGSFGILICGSGTGMQIAANKIKGIRAAFSYDEYSAKMAREDNDANVLTLRGREFDYNLYEKIVETFLKTNFSQKLRHKKRISLLD